MAYLIGTDEAGYGPNLGPLVISASVWEVPDGAPGDDLYQQLAAVISPLPERRTPGSATRVAMADSKVLYQSGKGLRLLERGLWAAFALLGRNPCTSAEVWRILAPESCAAWHNQVGLLGDNGPLPLDAGRDEVDSLGPPLREAFRAADVRLLNLRSRAIFPEEFNELVERHGSKGTALSYWTLGLLARIIADLPDGRISVVCDKHGGRNHYVPVLMEHFPDWLIEVCGEGRQRSVYRFGPPQRRVEICFQAGGESHLPTALASMASKYLRELAMRALNAFWCERVPGLAPTAGYPQDAARFKSHIAAVQKELGIEDRVIWRMR